MRIHKVMIVWAVLLLCGSCSSDQTYTNYSRYKASFTYFNVMTTTPLRNSILSPGEFCSVSLTSNRKLIFASTTMNQSVDVTANAIYQSFVCLTGYIVGMANMIELGSETQSIVCYDLACPNCYKNDAIKRSLTLREGGMAFCQRCRRQYDLNSLGIVRSGDAGKPLERYHVAYDNNNILKIWN